MPESLVTAPDGQQYRVTHPEGASQEDIFGFVQSQYDAPLLSSPDLSTPFSDLYTQPQDPLEEEEDKSVGVFDAIGFGVDQLQHGYGQAAEAIGKTTGYEPLEKFGSEYMEEQEEEMAEYGPLFTRFKDVDDFSSFLTYAKEGITKQAPNIAAMGAASLTGAKVGSYFGPLGAFAGSIIAPAVAVSAPQLFDENIYNQEEAIRKGLREEIDYSDALAAAIGQSALDTLQFRIMFGLKPGKMFTGNVFTRAAKGAATGGVTEAPTEVAQDFISRLQAGLPLDDPEAIESYKESAAAGGLVGGFYGGAAHTAFGNNDEAKRQALREAQEKKEAELRQTQEEYFQNEREKLSEQIAKGQQDLYTPNTDPLDNKTLLGFKPPRLSENVRTENATKYAQEISKSLGDRFPSTIFTSLEETTVPSVKEGETETKSMPSLVVRDTEGRQYGRALKTEDEAKAVADALNKQVIQKRIADSIDIGLDIDGVDRTNPNRANLHLLGNQTLNPESNAFHALQINEAAGITEDSHPHATLSSRAASKTGISVEDLTPVQRHNIKRRGKANREQFNFTPKEARKILTEEQFNKLLDLASATVPVDTAINSEAIQQVLNEKNIDAKVDSIEFYNFVDKFLGKRISKDGIDALSDSEKRLIYKRLTEAPSFPEPTPLPSFAFKPYLKGQYEVAANHAIQAREVISKEALDALPFGEITDKAYKDLSKDISTLLADRQNKGLLLDPFPKQTREQKRLEKIFNNSMKGYGLKDISVKVTSGLRMAKQDAEGNIYFSGPELKDYAYYNQDMKAIFVSLDNISNTFKGKKLTGANLREQVLDVLDHEIIHPMMRLDLFTQEEKSLLEYAVRNTMSPHKDKDGNQLSYAAVADASYPELNAVNRMEEAIAEYTRDGLRGRIGVKAKPKSLLNRIVRFLQQLIGFRQKTGHESFDQLFRSIAKGEIGARERGQIRTLQATERVRGTVPERGIFGTKEEADAGRTPDFTETVGDVAFARDMDVERLAELETKRAIALSRIKDANIEPKPNDPYRRSLERELEQYNIEIEEIKARQPQKTTEEIEQERKEAKEAFASIKAMLDANKPAFLRNVLLPMNEIGPIEKQVAFARAYHGTRSTFSPVERILDRKTGRLHYLPIKGARDVIEPKQPDETVEEYVERTMNADAAALANSRLVKNMEEDPDRFENLGMEHAGAFDTTFMSSGQGVQARGWGHYLSDLLSVAKFYQISHTTGASGSPWIFTDMGVKKPEYLYIDGKPIIPERGEFLSQTEIDKLKEEIQQALQASYDNYTASKLNVPREEFSPQPSGRMQIRGYDDILKHILEILQSRAWKQYEYDFITDDENAAKPPSLSQSIDQRKENIVDSIVLRNLHMKMEKQTLKNLQKIPEVWREIPKGFENVFDRDGQGVHKRIEYNGKYLRPFKEIIVALLGKPYSPEKYKEDEIVFWYTEPDYIYGKKGWEEKRKTAERRFNKGMITLGQAKGFFTRGEYEEPNNYSHIYTDGELEFPKIRLQNKQEVRNSVQTVYNISKREKGSDRYKDFNYIKVVTKEDFQKFLNRILPYSEPTSETYDKNVALYKNEAIKVLRKLGWNMDRDIAGRAEGFPIHLLARANVPYAFDEWKAIGMPWRNVDTDTDYYINNYKDTEEYRNAFKDDMGQILVTERVRLTQKAQLKDFILKDVPVESTTLLVDEYRALRNLYKELSVYEFINDKNLSYLPSPHEAGKLYEVDIPEKYDLISFNEDITENSSKVFDSINKMVEWFTGFLDKRISLRGFSDDDTNEIKLTGFGGDEARVTIKEMADAVQNRLMGIEPLLESSRSPDSIESQIDMDYAYTGEKLYNDLEYVIREIMNSNRTDIRKFVEMLEEPKTPIREGEYTDTILPKYIIEEIKEQFKPHTPRFNRGADEMASRILGSFGISGNFWPAQSMGLSKVRSDDNNYVIWNDDTLTIETINDLYVENREREFFQKALDAKQETDDLRNRLARSQEDPDAPAFARDMEKGAKEYTGFTRSDIDPQKVEEVVNKNLNSIKEARAGYVPRFSAKASPEAQYIAQNPEAAQEIPEWARAQFSRNRPADIDPELQTLLKNVIDDTVERRPAYDIFMEATGQSKFHHTVQQFRQGFVTRYSQLEWLNRNTVLRDNLADTSSIAAALFSDRSRGLAAAAIRYGAPIYRGGITTVDDSGMSLIQIMAPLISSKYGDLTQVAQAYAISRRSNRLDASGKKVPITKAYRDKLEKKIRKYTDKDGNNIIIDWHNNWQTYNNKTIEFLKDTGVLTDETAKLWQEYSDYYPFYRAAEGKEGQRLRIAQKVFGNNLTAKTIFTELKGSQEKINMDMLEAVSLNLTAAIDMGMRNVAQQRIARDLRDLGLAKEIPLNQKTDAFAVEFRVKGKPRKFEIYDPLIYQSMLPLGPSETVDLARKFLGPFTKLLRETIVRTPDFVVRNMIRDTISASVTSGSNYIPVIDTLRGWGDGVEKLEKFGVVGGYDYRNDPENITKFFRKEFRKHKIPNTGRGSLIDNVEAIWDWSGDVSTKSDAATRNAVYKDVLARTGNEAEAIFQAMEIINFSRAGTNPLVRTIAATNAFLNARVQGLDVFYRAATGQYSANSQLGKSMIIKSFATRASMLMGLTWMYYMLMADEDEYKMATDVSRELYWLLPNPWGDARHPLRIPVPFEAGFFFKTLPEIFLAKLYGGEEGRDMMSNKEVKNALARGIGSTLEFNPIPDALSPLVEAYYNHSFFTQRPIVPYYIDTQLYEELKTTIGTTEIAKKLSEAGLGPFAGLSPIEIDHVVKQYTGSMGAYALSLLDYAVRQGQAAVTGTQEKILPEKPLFEQPMIRSIFARTGSLGYKEDFYDLFEYTKKVTGSMKALEEEKRLDELFALMKASGHIEDMAGDVRRINKKLAEIRKDKKEIAKMDMSAAAKRRWMEQFEEEENALLAVMPYLKRMADMPAFPSAD